MPKKVSKYSGMLYLSTHIGYRHSYKAQYTHVFLSDETCQLRTTSKVSSAMLLQLAHVGHTSCKVGTCTLYWGLLINLCEL